VSKKSITELQIVERAVIPIYDIFDDALRADIEHLFQENERVIMLGVTRVNQFKWIDFQTPLKNANYKVFGKILNNSTKNTGHKVLKFNLQEMAGFAAKVERFAKVEEGIMLER